MAWLSESVEVLIAQELGPAEAPKVHDAVVVGSGYGGAVSALRLAQQGIRVLVLERGQEYVSGDFPNDIGEAFGHIRLERDGSHNINGYESGLYDLRIGDGIAALVGNALGGTSQINANVVLAPDARVFSKARGDSPAWPRPLVPDSGSGQIVRSLLDGYQSARKMLAPEKFTDDHAWKNDPESEKQFTQPVKTLKRTRLEELKNKIEGNAHQDAKVSFESVDLTINLGNDTIPGKARVYPCRGCGECVSGCNWKAKKTLTYTYLPQAREMGARMFTGVTVLSVRRSGEYWVVRFVRTETRKMQRDGVDVPVHELYARNVVLSAGTFGSTEILLRSKKLHDLPLSDQVGKNVSTNGDSLAFGYMLKDRVNGIGLGSGSSWPRGYAVGPTITGMIRINDPHDVTRSMLIQDGAVPGAIAGLFHEMISLSAAFSQLDKWKFRDMPKWRNPPEESTDWAALQARALTHTLTLLGIGHDPSAGTMVLDSEDDRLRMVYPATRLDSVAQLHSQYMKQVEKQGAIHVANPALKPLPDDVSKVLSGPRIDGKAFTVHPLGGCGMADDALTGVVNHLGEVFSNDGEAVHRGLYVLDGAIIPTSLGANPLFTITALAERAMEQIAPRIARELGPSPSRTPIGLEPYPFTSPPQLNPYAKEVNVNFTEALRATGGGLGWHGVKCDALLVLHMPINDLGLLGMDGHHRIPIPNQLGARRHDKEQLAPRLRIDTHVEDQEKLKGVQPQLKADLLVESGWISILPVPRVNHLTVLSACLRTGLTWLIERGFDETLRKFRGLEQESEKSDVTCTERIKSLFKLCHHASESRTIEYHLNLRDTQPNGDAIRTYTLYGKKSVGYAASWAALFDYITGAKRPLDRPNVWVAFGQLHTRILDESGQEVGSGILQLDMLDMTRMHAPQLLAQRDTPNALLALAGYPLWFARLLAKTRLWDFRLPDYPTHIPAELIPRSAPGWPNLPVPKAKDQESETFWPDFPPLRVRSGTGHEIHEVAPCPSASISVPRTADEPGNLTLKLTRYRQPVIGRKETAEGLTQFKTLLMLNGFAQSTLGFVPQEHERKPGRADDEPGLAEFFYEQGFDIWLFDYRTSSILDASKKPCTMDDIAKYDIPKAVQFVLKDLGGEHLIDAENIQIYAFAHCVGAASLAMSLLGGHLRHKTGTGQDKGTNQLAGVTFSQMQAFLVGSKTAQMRLRVGGILRDALGIDYMRLSAAERQPTALESMLDRLFASLPVDPGEHCPNEHNRLHPQPDICTCKRMSGTISRLVKHDRIKPETHKKLPIYFGRANTSLLVHGGRCVENERLVNADGQNVYVTDLNIKKYLDMPVAILHGKHNALFNVESATRTWEQFSRVHPHLKQADVCSLIIAEDYGHFDCTIGYGEDMQKQILTPLRNFYTRAWDYPQGVAPPPEPSRLRAQRSRAKAPLAGPLVGWSRTELRGEKHIRLIRLWIEVDESEADTADWVATHCSRRLYKTARPGAQLWPVIRIPLELVSTRPDVDQLDPLSLTDGRPYIAIALADLEFEANSNEDEDIRVHMFSVHSLLVEGPSSLENPQRQQMEVKAEIFPPLTQRESALALAAGSRPMSQRVSHLAWLAKYVSSRPSPHSGSNGQTIPPSGNLSVKYAWRLWKTLVAEQDARHQQAQQADPGTLSRKLRRLIQPVANRPGVALLKAETLRSVPRDGVVFVAASCRHPGLAFEDERSDASLSRITRHLTSTPARPAFMLMLGDQIYADATAGLMDSPSAVEKVVLSHQRAFGTRGFIDLTSSLPTYMVIDDHEIGDNWSRDLLKMPTTGPGCTVRDVNAQAQAERLFHTARAAFTAYQWSHGPRNGNVSAPGFNFHFEEGGCPFFVLDTRTRRSRFSIPPRICDPAQLEQLQRWLLAAGQKDPARPKFVVSGSVIAPGLKTADSGAPDLSDLTSDTWQMAQDQRKQLLDFIATNQIRNVVFVSGDYHCAATAELKFNTGLHAYAIVTPPLYAQLPAANVKHWQVLRKEVLGLHGGRAVTITATPRRGDGFAEVRALPLRSGQWELEVALYQMDSSDKAAEPNDWPRRFTLS